MHLEQSDEAELYLFLSVDIIDSTKKKYNQDAYDQTWTQYFYSFFKEFPDMFESCLSEIKKSIFDEEIDQDIIINPWKYAGDEILFYIKIEQKRQVPYIVTAFKKALIDWGKQQSEKKKKEIDQDSNTVVQEKDQNKKKFVETEIKGCIWLGQFPFIDKKFTYYEEDNGEKGSENKKIDFIGPSIDCGFRLGKFASKRCIVISMEVMDLCITSELPLTFSFYKAEELKGVGNMEYPIFNLLLNRKDMNIIEDNIISHEKSTIKHFLDAYYKTNETIYEGRISRINRDDSEHLQAYLTEKTKEWREKKYASIKISDDNTYLPEPIQNKDNKDSKDLNTFVQETINKSS